MRVIPVSYTHLDVYKRQCSPHRRLMERLKSTPFSDAVWEQYDLAVEQQRHRFFGVEWFFKDKKRRGNLK